MGFNCVIKHSSLLLFFTCRVSLQHGAQFDAASRFRHAFWSCVLTFLVSAKSFRTRGLVARRYIRDAGPSVWDWTSWNRLVVGKLVLLSEQDRHVWWGEVAGTNLVPLVQGGLWFFLRGLVYLLNLLEARLFRTFLASCGLQSDAQVVVVRAWVVAWIALVSGLNHRLGKDFNLLRALKLFGSGYCLWINNFVLCLIVEARRLLIPIFNRFGLDAWAKQNRLAVLSVWPDRLGKGGCRLLRFGDFDIWHFVWTRAWSNFFLERLLLANSESFGFAWRQVIESWTRVCIEAGCWNRCSQSHDLLWGWTLSHNRVSLCVLVVAGTGRVLNNFLLADWGDCDSLSVFSEIFLQGIWAWAKQFLVTRAALANFSLLASKRRACLPHLGVCLFWIVRTRSWEFFLRLPQSASDGHTFWAIPKAAMLFVGPWSVSRVVNNLFATVMEEFSLSAFWISQGLCLLKTIVTGPGGLRNLIPTL